MKPNVTIRPLGYFQTSLKITKVIITEMSLAPIGPGGEPVLRTSYRVRDPQRECRVIYPK